MFLYVALINFANERGKTDRKEKSAEVVKISEMGANALATLPLLSTYEYLSIFFRHNMCQDTVMMDLEIIVL